MRYIPQTCSGIKTYATEANAVKRAEEINKTHGAHLRYIIMVADNGRFVPVFIGQEATIACVHFAAHVLS
jgi:hypothetical protein